MLRNEFSITKTGRSDLPLRRNPSKNKRAGSKTARRSVYVDCEGNFEFLVRDNGKFHAPMVVFWGAWIVSKYQSCLMISD
jgi:hypothetical protein